MRFDLVVRSAVVIGLVGCGSAPHSVPPAPGPAPPPPPAAAGARCCTQVPRAANRALESVDAGSDWFHVYRAADGVFALVESDQFQEAISYLIVGRSRALLFDTGIGLVPIRPVVLRLTSLPIEVLNSHTHYDHVG